MPAGTSGSAPSPPCRRPAGGSALADAGLAVAEPGEPWPVGLNAGLRPGRAPDRGLLLRPPAPLRPPALGLRLAPPSSTRRPVPPVPPEPPTARRAAPPWPRGAPL